ncbi:MAG: ATP phosphoribosyltransferase regulatory subunit [Actinomycetota bacterium]|nr:ATP phosphoribosyltransferase regulatory subunit [Actinomycetota bacterium]
MFENKKDNQAVIKLPSGLRDILPPETEERNIIKEIIRKEFRLWGYGEVITPVMEYTKNISIGIGKNWKDRLINFFDVDGSPLSLRSDMTVPIARLTGMRIKKKHLPVRFYYFADSYRQPVTQKGARRVYNQAGLELIGASRDLEADVEVLTILIRILERLNLKGFKIGLGNVEFIEGLCDWFRLDENEREYVKKKVITKNLVTLEEFLGRKDKEKAEIFIKLIQPEGKIEKIDGLVSMIKEQRVLKSFNYIKNIYNVLREFNYNRYLVTDFSIIRDFEYYTGLLFEVYCPDVTGVIGSGGRYDGLIKKFGMDVRGTGFALDIDLVHKAVGKPDNRKNIKILLKKRLPGSEEDIAGLIEVARKLQEKDVIVELCFEDKPDLESFAVAKKCELIAEIEPDFKNLTVRDLMQNTERKEDINNFLKEISDGK